MYLARSLVLRPSQTQVGSAGPQGVRARSPARGAVEPGGGEWSGGVCARWENVGGGMFLRISSFWRCKSVFFFLSIDVLLDSTLKVLFVIKRKGHVL